MVMQLIKKTQINNCINKLVLRAPFLKSQCQLRGQRMITSVDNCFVFLIYNFITKQCIECCGNGCILEPHTNQHESDILTLNLNHQLHHPVIAQLQLIFKYREGLKAVDHKFMSASHPTLLE